MIPLPSFYCYKKNPISRQAGEQKGFSVIELLVTIGIFVLITGVLLSNYGRFSGTTVIDNLAHEVALSIRQAQVFGIGVQEFGVGTGIFPSHGINYKESSPTILRLFADTNTDQRFQEGELAEQFTLRRGNEIIRVCGYITSDAECTELSELNVTFIRPNPEATIVGIPDEGQYSFARITLESPRGLTRSVVIWSSGQVAIE